MSTILTVPLGRLSVSTSAVIARHSLHLALGINVCHFLSEFVRGVKRGKLRPKSKPKVPPQIRDTNYYFSCFSQSFGISPFVLLHSRKYN